MENRHTDESEIICGDCVWEGRVMDCFHKYKVLPDAGPIPIDSCPNCDSENLIPLVVAF